MAFGAKKIFPVDFKPGTAVGVALPFNGNAVFKSTYTTKDAIKYNLINFFLTNQPERYLNPLFGGNLRRFIFEQITTNDLDNNFIFKWKGIIDASLHLGINKRSISNCCLGINKSAGNFIWRFENI